MLIPVMRWQRRDTLLGETDPTATEMARTRALKMPFYRSVINVTNWLLGSIVFIVASWPVASKSAPVVAAPPRSVRPQRRSSAICSPNGCCGRWRSPPCAAGCRRTSRAPGVIQRQVLTWVLSTAVPILAIVLAVVASKVEILTAPADRLTTPILLLAITALVIRPVRHRAGRDVDR